MEKIVLYGAGNYCRLLLKGALLNQYEIIKVVDGDSRKWNSHIEAYVVGKPEELNQLVYDRVLIAAKAYKSIAEKLVGELSVPEKKILYADFDNNEIHELRDSGMSFRHGAEAVVEKILLRNTACKIIKEGLLFECLQNGEFEDYDEMVVVGEEEQLRSVKDFFSCMKERAPRVSALKWDEPIKCTAKYILTSASYRDDLARLKKEKGCGAEQCVIVPLYDVEDTVVV